MADVITKRMRKHPFTLERAYEKENAIAVAWQSLRGL